MRDERIRMLMFGGMQPKLESKLEVFAKHLQTRLPLRLYASWKCIFSPVIAAAVEIQRNCSCFIFSNLFQSLSFTYFFVSLCPSTTVAAIATPLPLIPVGQQCSSSVVSIIIIQSVLLSTNCQHSTNACLAINAIFLFSSHNFSNLLSFLIISFPFLFLFFTFSPTLYFQLIFYLPLSSFSRLLVVVVSSRSVWQWQEWREKGRKGREKGGSVHNWLFTVWQKEKESGYVFGEERCFSCFSFCVSVKLRRWTRKLGRLRERGRGDEVYNWADLPLTEIIPPGDRRQREQREGEWW